MFTELSHSNHSSKWMVPSLSCRDTNTCIACLLDVLNNTSLSQVQKQMSLDIMSSLVKNSVITLQLLTQNQDICYYIINLITDFYTEEPHRQTSVLFCAQMVHTLQDETLYELLLAKFQGAVIDMSNERRIQFFLLVLDQLCNVSLIYAKIILSSQTDIINRLLIYQDFVEVDTTSSLACLLTYVIKALSSSPEQLLTETDAFLWTIMVTLVFWLNTADSKSLQANCLALLKECLQLEDLSSGLLLVEQRSQAGHSLLMGLKRILLTKDEELAFVSTQCLTRLMENLKGTDHIREVFETDLAEFVFELLHTADNSKLEYDIVLFAVYFSACIPWQVTTYFLTDAIQYMVCNPAILSLSLFPPAVTLTWRLGCMKHLSLDSTLLATQEALDNGRSVIAEKGISFLTCLMDGQPECMPLFVTVSWSKCFQLLNACLQHRKLSLFLVTLKATKAFLRTQHQQSPVDVTSVITLLRTCLVQSDHHLNVQSEHSRQQQSFSIVSLLLDVTLINFGLVIGDDVLCGNMEEHIQELKAVIRDMSTKLILPWMLEHWDYLSDSSRIEKFLACLDVFVSADVQEQHAAELAHVVATGLPCQILSLSLQSRISDEIRRLMGHILTGLFLQLGKYLRPHLELNEEILITGFSRLTWLHQVLPGREGAENINSKEEAVAWFCLAYFSYLMAYRMWRLLDIQTFLERILQRYPDLLSYDMVVTRAFVYLQALCQTSDVDEDRVWCKETELNLMTYLSKSPVDAWLTEDPVVFRWSMLTETRASSIGTMLNGQVCSFLRLRLIEIVTCWLFCPKGGSITSVISGLTSHCFINILMEHWLLQLTPACSHGLEINTLVGDRNDVLLEMRWNYNFLHCLVVLLNSQAVANPARVLLIYCISSMTDNNTDSYHVALCESLFMEVTHKFEALFVQTAKLNALLLANMLSVMCELLESPLLTSVKMTSCFKSVYHAVKLAGIYGAGNGALAWTLKYLTCMTRSMSVNDSGTVIPALMKDDKFLEILEDSMTSCETGISVPALSLVAWLAAAEHQFQAQRPIVVTSDLLLSSLASCRYATSLPVLKLLNAALSTNCAAAPTLRRFVQFVKRQQNFESNRLFSDRELKQVYLYLQQFIVKEDVNLRSKAVECMKTLLNTHPQIRYHAHSQPWNPLMLEAVLTSRTQSGLTDSELDLCMLFLPSGEQMWMGNAGNSFLLALLPGLNMFQLDKATTIFRHIRQLPGTFDPEVLAAADEYLRQQMTSRATC